MSHLCCTIAQICSILVQNDANLYAPHLQHCISTVRNQILLTTQLVVRPKTKSELANEYEVSRNTIARWCKDLGIETRKLLSIRQVAKIYEELGAPGRYEQQMTLVFE